MSNDFAKFRSLASDALSHALAIAADIADKVEEARHTPERLDDIEARLSVIEEQLG